MSKNKKYFTPKEYAEITGIDLKTVYRMLKRGDIETLQKTPKCKHLIPFYEIPTCIREEKRKKSIKK